METPLDPLPDGQELYLERDLSVLEFNARVLDQARDRDVPLLERLRFLSISSTNLDEFFEVRVAGLLEKLVSGAPDAEQTRVLLSAISERAHELVVEQYRVASDVLLPALAEEGIRLLKRSEWTEAQRAWVDEYYRSQVLPVLTPIGLDTAHPFPKIQNKGLNFVLSLEGVDAFGRATSMAVVQVPRSLRG